MAFVGAGESLLYYESHGSGPALVFVHGVGGNHASWHKQVPLFSKDYRVIVIDQRAFGNSTDVEQAGRSRFVDDILLILDDLGIDKAILVGQSLGGGTCAAFTCAHPERVERLIIADSLVAIDAPEPLAQRLRTVEIATAGLGQAERVLGPVMRCDDPESTMLYLQIASFNSVNIRTLKGEFDRWSPVKLAETGVPVLFLVGEHDVLFPPDAVFEAHELVGPTSSFALIEGAGHSAYFERPVAFNAHLQSFLASR